MRMEMDAVYSVLLNVGDAVDREAEQGQRGGPEHACTPLLLGMAQRSSKVTPRKAAHIRFTDAPLNCVDFWWS